MEGWSQLPVDLLLSVEGNLVLYLDKVRIRAACVPWYSTLPKLPDKEIGKFPWLLQAHDHGNSKLAGVSHELFSPLEQKRYYVDLPAGAESRDVFFRGSSRGWIITIGKSPAITIINPLSKAEFKLPPRTKFPDVRDFCAYRIGDEYDLYSQLYKWYYVEECGHVNCYLTTKIVLSSAPDTDDCIAVAIYGSYSHIAYFICNGERWTSLPGPGGLGGFDDILFCKGKLYALTPAGGVFIFGGFIDDVKVRELAAPLPPAPRSVAFKCLAESSDGQLLQILRSYQILTDAPSGGGVTYCTRSFKVYKLDTNGSRWSEVKEFIGDDILFLGWDSSFSIPSSQFPSYEGNCICFTDNLLDFQLKENGTGSDIGVFSLSKGLVEQLPGYASESNRPWPPPVWVAPCHS